MTKTKKSSSEPPGQHAYAGLDRVLHEKARLGILTCLVTRSAGLVFNELKRQCSLTDGNLSRHLTILSDAGLVEQWKGQGAGRPQTLCRLTDSGRTRFLDYLSELERVIRDAVPERAARRRKAPGQRAPRLALV